MPDNLADWLLVPLQYPFMQRALMVGILVGGVSAVLSCFLILKGWSLLGDAISHGVLPGVAIAYVVGLPVTLGAFFSGLLCVWGIGWVKQQTRVKEDTVIGVLFTGFFAVGLILLSRIESDVHLMHILFGSLLGITAEDLIQLTVIAGGVLAVVLLKQRDLRLFCFDENYARSIGLNTAFLHLLFLSLLALTIVASMKTVGIILVIAMLISPGATAYLISDRFGRMLWIAGITAVLATVGGVYTSFYLDASTSGLIVLFQAAFFLLALVFSPKYGVFIHWVRQWRPA